MPRVSRTHDSELSTARLRERIYVTFTSLAVVLTLRAHTEDLTAGAAAISLTISAVGTVLAAFTAELVAELSVHAAFPDRPKFKHMVRTATGALGAIFLPMIFIGLAHLDVWILRTALTLGAIALVVTLGLVGYLGVRRTTMNFAQRAIALAVLVGIGSVVLALKLVVH